MRRAISVTLLGLLAASPVLAAQDAGLPGEFLNFGVGPRPLAMGRAFTAVADDVDALYWNPAGLAASRASQIEFQHVPMPLSTSEQYVAYSQPVYARGTMGIGILNLSSNNIPRIDNNNVEIGSFDHRETGYLGGYARRVNDQFLVGGTAKMAELSIDGRTKRGFGADAGLLYRPSERVAFGGMFRNLLAPSYDFASDKESFPRILRVGTAVNWLNKHLTSAFDLDKTVGTPQSLKWHLGLEGFVINNVILRAGVDASEITTGIGLQWRSIRFDYAAGFQEAGAGFVNRFGMKFAFGGFEVDVKASPSVFSPVGLNNRVRFSVYSAHRDRIVSWVMTIRNSQNDVVQSFVGHDAPPALLEWDGKDAQGHIVPAGSYTYQMAITDAKNRVEKTPSRGIRVVAPTPFEIEVK